MKENTHRWKQQDFMATQQGLNTNKIIIKKKLTAILFKFSLNYINIQHHPTLKKQHGNDGSIHLLYTVKL